MKQIADIIASGESETVEFKTAFNKDVIETAVAFAKNRAEDSMSKGSNALF